MNIEVARFAQIAPTPWKNGLGTTTQLAIQACTNDQSAFEWRVSIAALTGTAPFSLFADVERCLAMLEGEITLCRVDQSSVTLTPHSLPFTFSGSEPITGCVASPSALDLNLMYRSLRWRASMHRVTLTEGASLRTGTLTMLCVLAPTQLDVEGERVELQQYDLLRTLRPTLHVVARTELTAYAIEMQERDA